MSIPTINTSMCLEPLEGESALSKTNKWVTEAGPSCHGVIFSSNWSNHDSWTPPSGLCTFMKKDELITPGIISPKKLFQGCSVVEITNSKMDGKTIGKAMLERNEDFIQKALNSVIKQNYGTPCDLSMMDPRFNGKDKVDSLWEPCLDSPSSFLGLYSSDEEGTERWKSRFWLVAQMGVSTLSEQIFNQIEDSIELFNKGKGKKPTWDSVMKSKEFRYAYNASKRCRSRMLANFANALKLTGLNFKFDMDSGEDSKPPILEPTVETIQYNILDKPGSPDKCVYYAGTINPHSKKSNPVVFAKNPWLGITIMNSSSTENAWRGDPTRDESNAFPVTLGGTKTELMLKNTQFSMPVGFDEKGGRTIVISEGKKVENARLMLDYYRPLTSKFSEVQAKLGYDKNHAKDINLRPIMFKAYDKPMNK